MKHFQKVRYLKDFFVAKTPSFLVAIKKRTKNAIKVQTSPKNIYWLNNGMDSSDYSESPKSSLNKKLSLQKEDDKSLVLKSKTLNSKVEDSLFPQKELKKFFNQCFDKNRLKNFVLWFLLNYGENKTIELVEQLKNIGFQYASKAGISLGIDDLKIPPKKALIIYEAEKKTNVTIHQYVRGEITGVERFQRLIDTWHRTSEILKQEVIDHFESTDILNPVYMMAFSGARGNISQVRQLVGMRGLMADPQGQIIDFPIRSNFREGLTLTEYIISSYGARKGIVDTALRTANAGYLTRRLVDVAQHVVVSKFDCGTRRGIFLMNMKEGNKTIHSLSQRIIGRILARDLLISQKDDQKMIAKRNDEVSLDLAFEIGKHFDKVFVRSSLTCDTPKCVCQLCYGWSLAQGNLVSIGEAVGVVAAQSIGEPGTQLTMRTFHTGGVFSGDISDQIRAPFNGIVEYLSAIPGTLIRTPEGQIAFLTKGEGSFMIHKKSNSSLSTLDLSIYQSNSSKKYQIPHFTLLYIRNGQMINEKEVIAQITTISRKSNATDDAELTIKSEYEGQFYSKSLGFREKEIGPKIKADKEDSPYSQIETLYEAWTWGYAWILSGKIYESNYPSSFFAKLGDYFNSKSSVSQTKWKFDLNNGQSYQFCLSELNALLPGQIVPQRIRTQIKPETNISASNLKNAQSVYLNNFQNEQTIISLNVNKMQYKKYGYIFRLQHKNQFILNSLYSFPESKDLLFSMKSFGNRYSNDLKQNGCLPQSYLSLYGFQKKGSIRTDIQWYPKTSQTLTAGSILFSDEDNCNDIKDSILKKEPNSLEKLTTKLKISFFVFDFSKELKQILLSQNIPFYQLFKNLVFNCNKNESYLKQSMQESNNLNKQKELLFKNSIIPAGHSFQKLVEYNKHGFNLKSTNEENRLDLLYLNTPQTSSRVLWVPSSFINVKKQQILNHSSLNNKLISFFTESKRSFIIQTNRQGFYKPFFILNPFTTSLMWLKLRISSNSHSPQTRQLNVPNSSYKNKTLKDWTKKVSKLQLNRKKLRNFIKKETKTKLDYCKKGSLLNFASFCKLVCFSNETFSTDLHNQSILNILFGQYNVLLRKLSSSFNEQPKKTAGLSFQLRTSVGCKKTSLKTLKAPVSLIADACLGNQTTDSKKNKGLLQKVWVDQMNLNSFDLSLGSTKNETKLSSSENRTAVCSPAEQQLPKRLFISLLVSNYLKNQYKKNRFIKNLEKQKDYMAKQIKNEILNFKNISDFTSEQCAFLKIPVNLFQNMNTSSILELSDQNSKVNLENTQKEDLETLFPKKPIKMKSVFTNTNNSIKNQKEKSEQNRNAITSTTVGNIKKGWVFIYPETTVCNNQIVQSNIWKYHKKVIMPGQIISNKLFFSFTIPLFVECVVISKIYSFETETEYIYNLDILPNRNTKKNLSLFAESQTFSFKPVSFRKNSKSRYYLNTPSILTSSLLPYSPSGVMEMTNNTKRTSLVGLIIQPVEEHYLKSNSLLKEQVYEQMLTTFSTKINSPVTKMLINPFHLTLFKYKPDKTLASKTNSLLICSACGNQKKSHRFQKYRNNLSCLNNEFKNIVNPSFSSLSRWKCNKTFVSNKQRITPEPLAKTPNPDVLILPYFNSLIQNETKHLSDLEYYKKETPFVLPLNVGDSTSLQNGALKNKGKRWLTKPSGLTQSKQHKRWFFCQQTAVGGTTAVGSPQQLIIRKPINLGSFLITFENPNKYQLGLNGHTSEMQTFFYEPLSYFDTSIYPFLDKNLSLILTNYLEKTQKLLTSSEKRDTDMKHRFRSNSSLTTVYNNINHFKNQKVNNNPVKKQLVFFNKWNDLLPHIFETSCLSIKLSYRLNFNSPTTTILYDSSKILKTSQIFAKTTFYSPFKGEIVSFQQNTLNLNDTNLPMNPLDYSCMFLTKSNLISYYFPAVGSPKNFKEAFNQVSKEIKEHKYPIPEILVKFINMTDINSVVTKPLHIIKTNVSDKKKAGIQVSNLMAGIPFSNKFALLGDFFVYGDALSQTTAIKTSGQIIHYNDLKITLRRSQPIVISPKGILRKFDGDFIDPKAPVITLSYQRLKTGDIIQGIPKVEQYFEARTTKRSRLFRDSLPSLLKGLFKRYQSKLPFDFAVRQSFYKIQQIVVDGVHRVYKSQGVTISDKHLEVIVKQMTSKVRILDGAQTGFFAGEIVDLFFVEKINQYLIKKMTYEPLVLGITKASLEVDSFLSAASFQQTTRVLSKAAIYRKKDFLKGLKENVILGNLIPAGTGYLVYLDDVSKN